MKKVSISLATSSMHSYPLALGIIRIWKKLKTDYKDLHT